MKKIIILDFSTAEVYVYDFDEDVHEDGESFLISVGLKEKDCQWMITNELRLTMHIQ